MQPTPQQEKVLSELAKHYSAAKRPPRWYTRRDYLWKELTQTFQDKVDEYATKCIVELNKQSKDYNNALLQHGRNAQSFLKHIRRLQDQCRVLGEVIAEERELRQKAYKWKTLRKGDRFSPSKTLWKLIRGFWPCKITTTNDKP